MYQMTRTVATSDVPMSFRKKSGGAAGSHGANAVHCPAIGCDNGTVSAEHTIVYAYRSHGERPEAIDGDQQEVIDRIRLAHHAAESVQAGEDEHRKAERGGACPVARSRDEGEEHDQQRGGGGMKASEHQVVAVADPVRH